MDGEEKQAEGSQQIAVQPYTQVFAGLGERIPDALQSDLPKQEQTSEQSIEDINTKAENSLLKILDKSETERLKQQKPRRNCLLFFVGVQLFAFNGVIIYMVYRMCEKLDAQIITSILDFCKYYIGAVFLELIGMIWFITRSTFTSTSKDIIKGFIDRISKNTP